MKLYRIELIDNTGDFAIQRITQSCDGETISSVQNYNGECDLAIINIPDEQSEYLEEILDHDDNIILYREL